MNLYGTYIHNLDAKNRVFIPQPFREQLSGDYLINLDIFGGRPHIELCTREWLNNVIQSRTEQLDDPILREEATFDSRSFQDKITMDASGRITINEICKNHGRIEKSVVFIGRGDHVEVWSLEEYNFRISQSLKKSENERKVRMRKTELALHEAEKALKE